MPTVIQNFYEETTNEFGNVKFDKEKDQDIIDNLLKMIRCLSYGVHNNNIDMDFSNKIEVIKQYKQSVMNSKKVIFFQI